MTRDAALLTLNRSPSNLKYWMDSILEITDPRTHGRMKAEQGVHVARIAARGIGIGLARRIQFSRLQRGIALREPRIELRFGGAGADADAVARGSRLFLRKRPARSIGIRRVE